MDEKLNPGCNFHASQVLEDWEISSAVKIGGVGKTVEDWWVKVWPKKTSSWSQGRRSVDIWRYWTRVRKNFSNPCGKKDSETLTQIIQAVNHWVSWLTCINNGIGVLEAKRSQNLLSLNNSVPLVATNPIMFGLVLSDSLQSFRLS